MFPKWLLTLILVINNIIYLLDYGKQLIEVVLWGLTAISEFSNRLSWAYSLKSSDSKLVTSFFHYYINK